MAKHEWIVSVGSKCTISHESILRKVATDRAAPSLQKFLACLRQMLEDGENGGAALVRLTMSELAGVITAKKTSSHSWPRQHAVSCSRQFARLAILFILASMLPCTIHAQAPIYEVTPGESSIKFDVESSVPIKGTFSQWEASMTFKSTDVTTGVLDIKIQAESVDTGSGMKNSKLKGKDFFDVKRAPQITFVSTKVTQTGPATFDLEGDFTIRGVTRKEKLDAPGQWKGDEFRQYYGHNGVRPKRLWNE